MEAQVDYKKESLTFTDKTLLDSKGNAIMMEWEKPIMEKQAATICQNGGDVLNIGFGMGYIDSFIQEHNPTTHWIIECHPDVQRKMIEDGWLKKPNVKCIFKPWQEVIHYLPKFDGIYFDTWAENWAPFHARVKDLLNPNGVYSFFNNPRHEMGHGLKMHPLPYSILSQFCDITYEEFKIDHIAPQHEQRTDNLIYWQTSHTTYFNPTCKLKPEFLKQS